MNNILVALELLHSIKTISNHPR